MAKFERKSFVQRAHHISIKKLPKLLSQVYFLLFFSLHATRPQIKAVIYPFPHRKGTVLERYPIDLKEFLSLGKCGSYDPEKETFSFTFTSN